MVRTRFFAALMAMVVGVVALAGCASKTEPPAATQPSASTGSSSSAPAPAPQKQTGPKQGGTLTYAVARATTNLYPSRSSALPDISANFLLYDGLVITDDKGQIQPLLAKKWSSDPSGKVWTFELRDDVTFHSGRKLTSKDVKVHIDQWMKDAPTKGKLATVEKVETDGDLKVIVTLKNPNLVFLSMISQTEWSYGGIPDSEAVAKYGKDYGIDPKSISGTGPYMLKEWIRDDRLVLVRNPNYKWGPVMYKNEAAGYPNQIIIRTIPEAASRAAELEVGSIDMDLDLSPNEAPRLKNVKGVQVKTAPRNTAHHIGFNLDKELFKDKKLRQAVGHVVDQKALVEAVYNGYAAVAVGLFSDAVEGHAPKDQIAKVQPEFSIDKAKSLLEEAGWKAGAGGIREKGGKLLSFSLWVYTEVQEKLGIAIQANARQAGIDLKVRRVEFAAWREAVEKNEHDMYYVDGTHSTADISYWWTTTSIPYPNHPRVRDIDEMFKITQNTTDRSTRVKAFNDIEMKLVGEAYLIPMPRTAWLIGVRDHVKYTYWDPIHGIQKALDIWLDK